MRSWQALVCGLMTLGGCVDKSASKSPTTRDTQSLDGPPTPSLGFGLDGVADWSPQLAFLNLTKQARHWRMHRPGAEPGQGGPATTDENGWITRLEPEQWAELIVLLDQKHLPFDRFVVRWKGQGKLTYARDSHRVGPGPKGWNDTVALRPNPKPRWLVIHLKATNPDDPIRNIEVVPEKFRAQYEGGLRFNPVWLEKLAPFRIVRFMDWMRTNDSPQRTWADRPRVERMTYADGVPVEVMVDLANTLGVDAWFTIPHGADTDYMRRFAHIVKDGLDADRVAWFEHSNEVWNWGFGQAHWANAKGRYLFRNRKVLDDAFDEIEDEGPKPDLQLFEKTKAPYDLAEIEADVKAAGESDRLQKLLARGLDKTRVLEHLMSKMMAEAPDDAYMQWSGMRAATLCDVVKKEVYVNAHDRVRCVMATHPGWEGIESAMLECPSWNKAPCVEHGIDAYAITGYFSGRLASPKNIPQVKKWIAQGERGLQAALRYLATEKGLPDAGDGVPSLKRRFTYHGKIARRHSLALVAYEGGQHITTNGHPEAQADPTINQFFVDLNRHRGMADLYTTMFDLWRTHGGQEFLHFVEVSAYGKYGSWGAMEWLLAPSPKYEALRTINQKPPCWWKGCQRPRRTSTAWGYE